MSRLLQIGKALLLYSGAAALLALATAVLIVSLSVRSALTQARADEHAAAVHAGTLADQEAGKINTTLTAIAGDFNSAARSIAATQTTIAGLRQDLHPVIQNAAGTTARLNASLDIVNRPCGAKDATGALPCGTLADTARLMATYRGTAGQAEAFLSHEGKLTDQRDKQETDLYAHLAAVLTSLTALGDQGQKLLVPLTGTATDLQARLHPILNPAPCTTKKCRIGRDAKALLGLTAAGEGLYYSGLVVKDTVHAATH